MEIGHVFIKNLPCFWCPAEHHAGRVVLGHLLDYNNLQRAEESIHDPEEMYVIEQVHEYTQSMPTLLR